MNMLQVAVLGVAVQFKGGKTEYSTYIALGVSVLIFTAVFGQLEVLVDTVREIGDTIGLDGVYIRTMLKMIGITYAAELASSICKDAGYQTVAAQIEIFGKLLIMVLSVPILLMVRENSSGKNKYVGDDGDSSLVVAGKSGEYGYSICQ